MNLCRGRAHAHNVLIVFLGDIGRFQASRSVAAFAWRRARCWTRQRSRQGQGHRTYDAQVPHDRTDGSLSTDDRRLSGLFLLFKCLHPHRVPDPVFAGDGDVLGIEFRSERREPVPTGSAKSVTLAMDGTQEPHSRRRTPNLQERRIPKRSGSPHLPQSDATHGTYPISISRTTSPGLL